VYILSLHLSHEGCATYIKDNEIIFHTQLDRYNRFKNTTVPSKAFLDIIKSIEIDLVLITFLNENNSALVWREFLLTLPNLKDKKFLIYGQEHHHLFHAYCSLTWNKKIKNILIVDGRGKKIKDDFERESLFKYDGKLNHIKTYTKNEAPTIGSDYESFTQKYFQSSHDCGKTMAWSLYDERPKKIQTQFENRMDNIVREFNIEKEVLFSGGCAQNILYNSKLLKKFNNVFCDPFNGDFGISLGAANYFTNNNIKNNNIYLGIPQKINTDLFLKHKINKCTYEEVSKILINNPIAIFQSRSEQGQRGLGNRSLLMNPSHDDAHSLLNSIKKREWFRPFACSILKEKAKDWFDMSIDESPYMMFVFKLRKLGILKAGISVDNHSRIQTVSDKNNLHYYNLIKSFYKLTNLPIIVNTSLNLPGEVLVETLYDLKIMFENSNLQYIYFPEIQTIIKKQT
tara:strand:+ start:5871 stop:7238 length:1368 start_codon:yes stop_codon:yes gene_type:complete